MIFKVGNKVVGELDKGVFKKTVIYFKHHLNSYHAWAIDEEVVKKLAKENCKEIIIIDKSSGKEFKITFEDFNKRAFTINHGYGNQAACADIYWNKPISTTNQVEMFEKESVK